MDTSSSSSTLQGRDRARESERAPGHGRGDSREHAQENVATTPFPSRARAGFRALVLHSSDSGNAVVQSASLHDDGMATSSEGGDSDVTDDSVVAGGRQLIPQDYKRTTLDSAPGRQKRKLITEPSLSNSFPPNSDAFRPSKRTTFSSKTIHSDDSTTSGQYLPHVENRRADSGVDDNGELNLRGGHMASTNDFDDEATSCIKGRPVELKPERTEVELHASAKAQDYDLQQSISGLLRSNNEIAQSKEALIRNKVCTERAVQLKQKLQVLQQEQSKDAKILAEQLASLASDDVDFSNSAALKAQQEITEAFGSSSTTTLRLALQKREEELTKLRLEQARWHMEQNSPPKTSKGSSQELTIENLQGTEDPAANNNRSALQEAQEQLATSNLRVKELERSQMIVQELLEDARRPSLASSRHQNLPTHTRDEPSHTKPVALLPGMELAITRSTEHSTKTFPNTQAPKPSQVQLQDAYWEAEKSDMRAVEAKTQSARLKLSYIVTMLALKFSSSRRLQLQDDLKSSQSDAEILREEKAKLVEASERLQEELNAAREVLSSPKASGVPSEGQSHNLGHGLEVQTLGRREEVAALLQPSSEIPEGVFQQFKIPVHDVPVRAMQTAAWRAHWVIDVPLIKQEQKLKDCASITRESLHMFCSHVITPERVIRLWRSWEDLPMESPRKGRMLAILFGCASRILLVESICRVAWWLVEEFCCSLCDHLEKSLRGPKLEQFELGTELAEKIAQRYTAGSPIDHFKTLAKAGTTQEDLLICECFRDGEKMELCMALDFEARHVVVVYEEAPQRFSLVYRPIVQLHGGRRKFRTWIQLPGPEEGSVSAWELDARGDGSFQKWLYRIKMT